MKNLPLVVNFAGFDISGGAGILRDEKVFSKHGIWSISVPTLLTVQDEHKFYNFKKVDDTFFKESIDKVLIKKDFKAIKIGLINDKFQVDKIIELIKSTKPNIVLMDPVIESSSGMKFWDKDFLNYIKENLFPKLTLITPNYSEFKKIMGKDGDIKDLIYEFYEKYKVKLCLTGGVEGKTYVYDGMTMGTIELEFINTPDGLKHGTGCAFSSSLISYMLLGMDIHMAAKKASNYLENIIRNGVSYSKDSFGLGV
jgi:hydroxymethylpyrimidine/phosphomethylpyrimidine kinase